MSDDESPKPTALTPDVSENAELAVAVNRPWTDPQSFLLIPLGVVGVFVARLAEMAAMPTSVVVGVWFVFYLNSGLVEHRQNPLIATYRIGLVGVCGIAVALASSADWMWISWGAGIVAYVIAAALSYVWRSIRN